MDKRVLFLILTVLLASSAIAVWNPDVDDDNCVDQADYDAVDAKTGSTGTNDFDVDGDMDVDDKDLEIVQSYLDRAIPTGSCDGFLCKAELCNGEDDDCDGNVDEDEGMCGDNMLCRYGDCVFTVGDCYDSDGNDIYTQGNAIGETADKTSIQKDEACYEADIYRKLKEIQQCYGDDCYMIEYWCNEHDNLVQEQISCDYGCRFGKCRQIEKKCIEEDNGMDIFRNGKGTFVMNGQTINLSDTCKDTDNNGAMDTLVEYECTEEFDISTSTLLESYVSYEITCACEAGVCANVVEKACIDTDGNDRFLVGYTKGKTQESKEINDFDYCMVKIGMSFNEVEKCSGSECFLTEYGCDPRDQVVKYVHECPLGCIEGLCIGTECMKGEIFIVNNGLALGYDDKCDIKPFAPTHDSDKPNLINMKDYACCSGSSEAYCVYNDVCYPSSRTTNYYEFEGEIVVCGCEDASCGFEDGNHAGVWFDMDSSMDICEGGSSICNRRWYVETGFKWIKSGETLPEYEDKEECCGDDAGEHIVCQGENCICCDSASDTYAAGKCHQASTTPVQPAQTVKNDDIQETPKQEIAPEPIVDESPYSRTFMLLIPISIALIAIIALFLFGRKHSEPPKK